MPPDFVGTGTSRLFVRDIGRGLPIVVVHGGPDFDHRYLVPEMDRLAESFRLVYYDQRGRGRSFSGTRPPGVTMATEVDDLDRVRQWSGAASIVVLGHSWGALLAMEYAIRHPGRVSHLILMNPAPASRVDALAFRDELARRRTTEQTERMEQLRADPRFAAGDIGIEAEYYRLHYGTTLRDPERLDAVVRRLRSAFTAEGILAAREVEDGLYEDSWSRDGYDLLPALRRIDIPTLVIRGEDDFVPPAVVQHIAEAIHGARVVELSGCGHFAYIEQPDRSFGAITEFLTGAP